ncbi:MAG TPA: ELWxxDGT repeat protein [Candidatus Methylomirabilis sp.]|nr:ELWxxDGT repeat protein [Candidatus Methylomirabilis sp.]
MYGDAGDDTITAGDGDNLTYGGAGIDHITIGSGNSTIYGEAGNDVITVAGGNNCVYGGDDNDTITTGPGSDFIHGDAGNDVVRSGAGSDTVYGDAGDDTTYAGLDVSGGGDTAANLVFGGTGADIIYGDLGPDTLYGGDDNDTIRGLAGIDTIYGEGGNDNIQGNADDDLIVGGAGSDILTGDGGSDVVWGGFENITLDKFRLGAGETVESEFDLPPLYEAEGHENIDRPIPPRIMPKAVYGLSLDGVATDGADNIRGGEGDDFLLGGGDTDDIDGQGGSDYIDGGAGGDTVRGGPGDDVVRGGVNNDSVQGGSGLDQLYGDSNDDLLFGDSGGLGGSQLGQRLWGGDGSDYLYAYAPTLIPGDEAGKDGDEMHGGAGNDWLYGNLRKDVLFGDDDKDYLHGDYLAGPSYAANEYPALNGGNDLLYGGWSDDKLYGGGGEDDLWGGGDSDRIEGQDGMDQLHGGSGIDVLVLDAVIPGTTEFYTLLGGETLRGHDGNLKPGDAPDDNATDIVLINGTNAADTILLSQQPVTDLLDVAYTIGTTTRHITAEWRDEYGPLVEQFDITGLGGNDYIEFVQGENALDLAALNARSIDWVGVIDGGPGNDVLLGTFGRDRLDGGEGSDIVFGLGGDDRLWGDSGVAPGSDYDRLFGGQGHDDLIGGQGNNDLYAWSLNPNVAYTELRFALGITTADPADSSTAAALIGSATLPKFGRLSGDAVFSLTLGSGAPVSVSLTAPDTWDNYSPGDLITDLNEALAAAGLGSQVTASLGVGNKLVLTGPAGVSLALDTGKFGVWVDGRGDLHASDDGDRNNDGLFDQPDLNGNATVDPFEQTPWVKEDTGLNRSLGSPNDDRLYGGTALDFLYGYGGEDTLFRQDGTAFESLDGGVAGDEWKEYAKSTGKVWYYSGTDANDFITVDYVTEPGLLQAHHLITRTTENNGNYTFDAQVQLDFTARDAAGDYIWDQADTIFDPERLQSVNPRDLGTLLPPEGDFLAIIIDALGGNDEVNVGPTVVKTVWTDAGQGDDIVKYAAGSPILIDKGESPARNDTAVHAYSLGAISTSTRVEGVTLDSPDDIDWYSFTLGFTPRTGDTISTISLSLIDAITLQLYGEDGTTLIGTANADAVTGRASLDLVGLGLTPGTSYRLKVSSAGHVPTIYEIAFSSLDTADAAEVNNTLDTAFQLREFQFTSRITGLALQSASDVDWYKFTPSDDGLVGDTIKLDTLTVGAHLTLQITDAGGTVLKTANASGLISDLTGLIGQTTYYLKVAGDAAARYRIVPVIGDVGGDPVDLEGFTPVKLASDLAVLRRDVILGGAGNDILQGGPGEDWIFGGVGNDVLTGGLDRQASDLLFGECGEDIFQLIADDLPLVGNPQRTVPQPGQKTLIPTLSDWFDGGAGSDQVEFLGGDFDRLGRPVNDFVGIRYNANLHRYEFSSLVWDIANQCFVADATNPLAYKQQYIFFQARNIEKTVIDTRSGDDEVHGDAGYRFPGTMSQWGVYPGDLEQGATIGALDIRGGDGNDRLFGGAQDDTIDGGSGLDFIVGGEGDDQLTGGDGDDLISGDASAPLPGDLTATTPDRFEYATLGTGESGRNDAFRFAGHLGEVKAGNVFQNLSFSLDDKGDWYIIKTPEAFKSFGSAKAAKLLSSMIEVQLDDFLPPPLAGFTPAQNLFLFPAQDIDPGAALQVEPVEQPVGVPDYYLLHLINPRKFQIVTPEKAVGDGRLTGDAYFYVKVDGANPVSVTVLRRDTDGSGPDGILGNGDDNTPNNSVDNLVDDIRNAITVAGLSSTVGVDKTLDDYLVFSRKVDTTFTANSSLEIVNPSYYARTQLKLISGLSTDVLTAARGTYKLKFNAPLGETTEVGAGAAGQTIGSTDPADLPIAIPLGDLNKDGLSDFIAAIKTDTTEQVTLARVAFGSNATGVVTLPADGLTIRIPSLLARTQPAENSYAIFGTPGDYNGDGFDDIAIALTHATGRAAPTEGVYLIFGRPTPWTGTLDLLTQSDVVISGVTGTIEIADAGDLDGDHIDDLAIADAGTGNVSIFYGRNDWSQPDLFLADFTASGAPSLDGFTLENALPGVPPDQVDGLWHLSTRRSSDTGHTSPDSLWFGSEATGTYSVGHTAGNAVTSTIDLTSVSGAELSFNYLLKTENSTHYDAARVVVQTLDAGGNVIDEAVVRDKEHGTLLNNATAWTKTTVNLAAFTGQRIRVAFQFDTIDAIGNAYEGWFIDDVRVKQFLTVANPDSMLTTGGGHPGMDVAGLGDFSADGRPDLAVLVQTDARKFTTYVLKGSTSRLPAVQTLAATAPDRVSGSTSVDTLFSVSGPGNVDGDVTFPAGRRPQDLLVTSGADSWLVFGNSLSGAIEFPVLEAGGKAIKVNGKVLSGVGDLDGDGKSDLGALAFDATPRLMEGDQNNGFSFNYHPVGQVFLGATRGSLSFAAADLLFQPAKPDYIVSLLLAITGGRLVNQFAGLGDVNGDKDPDLGFADAVGGNLSIYFGQALQDNPAATAGLAVEAEPFVFQLATPLLPTEQPRPGLILPNGTDTPLTLRDAFGLSGTAASTQLSDLTPVGDINDDGFIDFAASGATQSFILLGPVNLTDLEDAATRAEMIVDTSSLGRIVQGSGDVDGDGLADLVFSRATGTTNTITVVFGQEGSWPRSLSTSTIASSGRHTITLTGDSPATDISLLYWNGDNKADLLIDTPEHAYILSGASFAPGGTTSFSEATFSGLHKITRDPPGPIIIPLNARATVVGDVNGDGLDDVMFVDTASSADGYLLLGRITTGVLTLTGSNNVSFDINRDGAEAFALGDLNRDGYDDFAFGGTIETEATGGLLVYYGSAGYVTTSTGLPENGSTADFQVHRRSGSELAGGLLYSGRLRASAGDFNADGKQDLVVLENGAMFWSGATLLDIITKSRAWVDYSVAEDATAGGGTIVLSTAEVQLQGEQELSVYDLFAGLGGTGHSIGRVHTDLNRDGIDDLIVGLANADIFGDRLVDEAGRIYVLYGTPRTLPLPELGDAIPLVNASVPGAGDFLIGADATPIRFGNDPLALDINGDGINDFQLLSADVEKWFRFTTQGDGKAGNEVRVITPAEESTTTTLKGNDSNFSGSTVGVGGETFDIGTVSGDGGLLEVDLSGYLEYLDHPEDISSASLVLDYVRSDIPAVASGSEMCAVGSTLYFAADGGEGVELWRTDGTVLGTGLVEDIDPAVDTINLGSITLHFPHNSNPGNFFAYGSVLIFTATTTDLGTELWRSNGTAAGTYLVKDINPADASSNPAEFTLSGGILYFSAESMSGGRELWRTDGTTAGTVQVANINPAYINVGNGTLGYGSYPAHLTDVNGVLYFAADDGTNGAELWKSQGSSQNTVLVSNINAGATGSSPGNLTNVGGTLFFTASQGNLGVELWKSNGTSAGTALVKDIAAPGSSRPGSFFNAGGVLLFSANDTTTGSELWKSDGTLAGTTLVANINPGGASSTPQNFTQLGTYVYFTANDGQHGRELWRVNVSGGVVGTPQLFADIAPDAFVGSDPADMVVLSSRLFFTADSGDRVRELWATDGTAKGTVLVSSDPQNPSGLEVLGSKLAFTADGPSASRTLWLSTGSSSGTKTLSESGLLNRTLVVSILNEEGDYVVRDSDVSAPATQAGTRNLNTVPGTSPIEVDITAAVREALAAGKTRLTLRYGLNSPSAILPLTIRSATATGSQTGLKITTARQDGVLVDLYDANAGLLKSGVSIADLRMTEAGTYYLRVYNPFQATQTEPLPFQIEITAPLGGQYHALSDHDTVHGGDGNDIIIGNKHIDFLFGDRGEDEFLAEQVEVRDADAEFIGGVREGEDIVQSQHDLEPLNSEVPFNDLRLEVAVAEKLGIPVTTKWDGTPLVQEPITASGMVTLFTLDLGGMGLSDLTGLEFATNITTLNLANNQVKDLFTLVPRTLKEGAAKGSLVGLSHLQNLALDYNGLASIAPLTGILGIKALSLDNNPLVDLTPIALWREILPPSKTPPLEFLSLDNTGIGPMSGSGLYGEYFAGAVTTLDWADLRFLDPTHTRVDSTLNFADTNYDFAGYTDLDSGFGVRWTGQVSIGADQDVVFHTAGLGLSRLFVDGVLVLENVTGTHVSSDALALTAGWHDIELEYTAWFVAGGMRFSYTLEGGSEQIIPAGALRPRGQVNLDPIKGLANLRILSAEHNALVDLAPISWLDKLELVYLKDNDIQNIGAAAGGRLIDDGEEGYGQSGTGWLQNRRPVAGAFRTDYQFHAGVAGVTTGEAEWTFSNVRPGRYEVFVTWPSHETRASNIPFSVLGGEGGLTPLKPEGADSKELTLNQRFSPSGADVGGRPWQSLGVFESSGEVLKVIASLSNTDGSVAADAVRLVALDPVLPSLELLDVSGNPLGNDSYIQYVPTLLAREVSDPGFDLIYTANSNAPLWTGSGLIGPQASRGETLSMEITNLATDADGTSITYTATSSTGEVQVELITTQIIGQPARHYLNLTPNSGFVGIARITLTGHDDATGPGSPKGRIAEQTFDFTVDAGAIYGQKWNDQDLDGLKDSTEAGLEGWVIYIDVNQNGQLDGSELRTLTDANGDYSFPGLTPFRDYTVGEAPNPAWVQTAPLGGNELTLVRDIYAGTASSSPYGFAEYNGNIYFAASGLRWVAGEYVPTGFELYKLDPTTGVVSLAADISSGGASSYPDYLTVFKGNLYFAADAGDGAGVKLWRFNGSTASKVPEPTNYTISDPSSLTVFDGRLYFSARVIYSFPGANIDYGYELWSTDGTSFSLAADINPAAGASSYPTDLTVFGTNLYFSAYDPATSAYKLWKYNGSTATKPTEPSLTTVTSPANLTVYNGRLYFSANGLWRSLAGATYNYGHELWSTDGTAITLTKDIAATDGVSSYPSGLTVYGSSLYFSANGNDGYGTELWRYTSTSATTQRVTDLYYGSGSSSPYYLTVFDGKLYFRAGFYENLFDIPMDHGTELIAYDGTSAKMVADLGPGSQSSYPSYLFAYNNRLYFNAYATNTAGGTTDGVGYELWSYGPQRVAGAHTEYVQSGQGLLNTGVDFGNFLVADAGPDVQTNEGSSVSVTGTAYEPDPANGSDFEFSWSVTDPEGDAVPVAQSSTGQGWAATFTPTDNGDYTATLTVIDWVTEAVYVDTAHVFVRNVAPTFGTSSSGTVNAGKAFTRIISFTDPGADQWNVTVDYGDGTVASPIAALHQFTLNHVYELPGERTISITLEDDDGGEATGTILVSVVTPVPTANDDEYTATEDSPLVVSVGSGILSDDSDPDGNTLSASLVSGPVHGQLALGTDGAFTYTPNPDYFGSDSFTYTAANEFGGVSAPATVMVQVAPVNDAPSFAGGEDVTLAEDSGPQSIAWATAMSAGPANEAAQLLDFQLTNDNPGLFQLAPTVGPDGVLTFRTTSNASGSAHLFLVLHDNGGTAGGGVDASPAQPLVITVIPVNDAPVAVADVYSTNEDQAVSGSVLTNDSDADTAALLAELVSGPGNGTLLLNADGTFTYTPVKDFNGSDSFTYRAFDGDTTSDPATVSISVHSVNDAPSFQTGADVAVAEDSGAQTRTGWAASISTGAGNEGSQTLTFAVTNDSPALFSVQPSLTAAGVLTFTPAPNANGTAQVTVTLKDSGGTANGGTDTSAPQTFTITVTEVNDAPVAAGDAYTTAEETPLTIAAPDLLANDTDMEGDPLIAELVAGPVHGTLTLGTDGGFTYIPDLHYTGPDHFTYLADDDEGAASAPVTVTLTVVPISAPYVITGTAGDDAITLAQAGGVLTITVNSGTPTTIPVSGLAHIQVFGLAGNDTITLSGLTLPAMVDAGGGNDSVDGSTVGAGVPLTLLGGVGHDTLRGGGGPDLLAGGSGNDRLFGGEGDDLFLVRSGEGRDLLDGGPGTDALFGIGMVGASRMTIDAAGTHIRVIQTTPVSGGLDLTGIEQLRFTARGAPDSILVGDLSDTDLVAVAIDAGSGDDLVNVSALGAPVPLTLHGGAGNDTLLGGPGSDILLGGAGADTLDGNSGNDRLLGGAGDDILVARSREGQDRLEGGSGSDVVEMTATDGADWMTVSATGGHANLNQTAPVSGSLDFIGIEHLHITGGGGLDNIVVGDLSGTDMLSLDVDGIPVGGIGSLLAAAPPATTGPAPSVTEAELNAIVDQAIAQWADTNLVTDAALDRLEQVTVQLTDLPGLMLGQASATTVFLDVDAAGFGWFVDPTPGDNLEYVRADRELLATSTAGAAGHMDLLTVVLHELGHALGFLDLPGQTTGLMAATLEPGVRRLPQKPAPSAPETFGSLSALEAQADQKLGRGVRRAGDAKGLIDWEATAQGALLARHPLGPWGGRRLTAQVPEFVFSLEGRNGAEYAPPLAGLTTDFAYEGEEDGTLVPGLDGALDPEVG